MTHSFVDGICTRCKRSEQEVQLRLLLARNIDQQIADICDGWGAPLEKPSAVIDSEVEEDQPEEDRATIAVCPSCGARLIISVEKP